MKLIFDFEIIKINESNAWTIILDGKSTSLRFKSFSDAEEYRADWMHDILEDVYVASLKKDSHKKRKSKCG